MGVPMPRLQQQVRSSLEIVFVSAEKRGRLVPRGYGGSELRAEFVFIEPYIESNLCCRDIRRTVRTVHT